LRFHFNHQIMLLKLFSFPMKKFQLFYKHNVFPIIVLTGVLFFNPPPKGSIICGRSTNSRGSTISGNTVILVLIVNTVFSYSHCTFLIFSRKCYGTRFKHLFWLNNFYSCFLAFFEILLRSPMTPRLNVPTM